MKKNLISLLLGLTLALASLAAVEGQASAMPASQTRQTLRITPSTGWDIYNPPSGKNGWRYGPSVVLEDDGDINMWTCGDTKTAGVADEIYYKYSSDGGHTWTPESMALTPTTGSLDSHSTCDPGAIRYQNTWFLAYTSTTSLAGVDNNVFVAKSVDPFGGFKKWDGVTWGGNPAVIAAHPSGGGYGAGEPSMVVKRDPVTQHDILYLYYTWNNGIYGQTRLKTADLSSGSLDQWPSRLVDRGVVINRTGRTDGNDGEGNGATVEDQTDVKWVDDLDKFVAVVTGNRFANSSFLKVYESTDGVNFTKGVITRGDWVPGAHNMGISGTALGHLHLADDNFIAYGYGTESNWGKWSTRMNPITLDQVSSGGVSPSMGNSLATTWTRRPDGGPWENPAGALMASDGLAALSQLSLTDTAFNDVVYDVDVKFSGTTEPWSYAALSFAQVKQGDTITQSGYTVRIQPDGTVDLYKGGTEGSDIGYIKTNVSTSTNPKAAYVHLRVVQSGPSIVVFVGDSVEPVIAYLGGEAPFMGGNVSLSVSRAVTYFKNFSARDNVDGTYAPSDWTADTPAAASTWSVDSNGTTIRNTGQVGQFNLTTTRSSGSGGSFSSPWVGGDGTYRVTLKMTPGTDQTAWAGVNLVNDSYGNLIWTAGGYLVFLRRNGNLGLFKSGYGQVVADVDTGTSPTTTGVDLRIVTRGRNVQVYVNQGINPSIDYDDPTMTPRTVGAVGLTTHQTSATFNDFSIAANNPR